jgi:hypothetical protein
MTTRVFAFIGAVFLLGAVAHAAPPPAPSFARATQYRTTNGAADVAIGDLNGDGRPDIVAANPSEARYEDDPTGTISVFLNRGDGTFAPRRDYITGDYPVSVAIADVDSDGRPDLAAANQEDYSEEQHFTVSVLMNRGDGSFLPRQDYPVGEDEPSSLASGDVDGNGSPDLVIATDRLSVLLNDGHGSFGARHDYLIPAPDVVALADVNGDGAIDALAGSNATVAVLINHGDGIFGAPMSFAVGGDLSDVATGDLNGDGGVDLAVAHDSLFVPSYVSVLLNDGNGAFGAKRDYQLVEGRGSVAIADMNGDGTRDVVGANAGGLRVSILYGTGGGSFLGPLAYSTGAAPVAVAVGDLDSDGRPDLVTANNEDVATVSVLLSKPGLCNVQNLRRMAVPAARNTLARAHCAIGRVRSSPSRTVRKGHVISQKPLFGAVRPAGARVNIVISSGRKR